MRLAILQMRAVAGDIEANLTRIAEAAQDAATQGADLLVAPELAIPGYGAGEAMTRLAEPADGTTAKRLAAIARRTGVALVTGFAERHGETVWNSAILCGPDGRSAVYRKSHLYGAYERGLFSAAAPGTILFEIGGLRIGMLICYDVEFPENVRRLALAGADLVVVPTALPASDHDELIARSMIRVRAFENQVYVAYVNHCGSDGLFDYAGLSCVAAPDGSLPVVAGREEALHVTDIKPTEFAASRASNSYLADLKG